MHERVDRAAVEVNPVAVATARGKVGEVVVRLVELKRDVVGLPTPEADRPAANLVVRARVVDDAVFDRGVVDVVDVDAVAGMVGIGGAAGNIVNVAVADIEVGMRIVGGGAFFVVHTFDVDAGVTAIVDRRAGNAYIGVTLAGTARGEIDAGFPVAAGFHRVDAHEVALAGDADAGGTVIGVTIADEVQVADDDAANAAAGGAVEAAGINDRRTGSIGRVRDRAIGRPALDRHTAGERLSTLKLDQIAR